MVKKLANSGCDCVKFQIYEASEIVSGKIKASDYNLEKIYGDISASRMFDENLKTPKKWFPDIIDLAHELGLNCAATIHGENGLEWASEQNLDIIKIASMDHTNVPLLKSLVNNIDVPILISFGMAELADIDRAMAILEHHNSGVGLFYCVATYPPKEGDISLSNIKFLADRFDAPIGFSDHTTDITTACAALAMGASIFEKHVTHNKLAQGPDHSFALEFDEFRAYVDALRQTHGFLGHNGFSHCSVTEKENRLKYLKSIIVNQSLPVGSIISVEDIYLARPGIGIPPRFFDKVIGCKLAKNIDAEEPLTLAHLGRSEPFVS